MISKLLYKELRLAAHPTMYIFTLLGALVLVPAYPYGLVFMFGSLAPSITFMYCRETRDMYYDLLQTYLHYAFPDLVEAPARQITRSAARITGAMS